MSRLTNNGVRAVTVLAALLLALPWAAPAATPPSGTVSEANANVTWSGQPLPPTASAECNGDDDPACDNFKLSILPPTSFSEYVVTIVITPTGGDDYDLQVYDPNGNLAGSSGNAPSQSEQVNLFNPSAGTYTVSVANFAAALPYAGSATLADNTGGGGGGPPGTETVSFGIHTPPSGIGANAAEPSLGTNWESNRFMYIAGLEVLRIDRNQCTSPETLSWTDVTFPLQGITTLDPILFTDYLTNRTFASQLSAKCSSMAFTDNDGESWTPSQGCGINSGVDHQSVGGGPFHAPLTRDPDGPVYPNAVYYCSQDLALAQCARSDTGGLTFNEATPMYTLLECGGLHGHIKVGPDGTAYMPNKNCGGENAVVVSEANGLPGSWEVRHVPGTSSGTWDPAVGVASRPGSGANGTGVDTVYVGMVSSRRPWVAVSNDRGQTWLNVQDVGLGAGPLGGDIVNTAFPAMIAGDGDRAAFFFLGSEQPGDASGSSTTSNHVWYPYVSVTYDGGQTWSTNNITPDDPVQRGNVCAGGIGCGGSRNLLDFNDVWVDREGRIVAGYADGCLGSCKKNPPNSGSELATVAIQVNGKRLFAEYDVASVPDAPKFDAKTDDVNGNLIHITWLEPDAHGNPILEYNVYRRFLGENQATLIATLAGTERAYDDLLAPGDPPVFYRVTAANVLGESAFCQEISPEPPDPPESPCVLPGISVAEDPAGDTNLVVDPAADPSLDLREVFMAEPDFGVGAEKLVVTIDVEDLSLPHPSASWRVLWTSPDGQRYFVALNNCNAAAGVECSYGTFDGTIFSSAGAPEGCEFNADGRIEITVDKGLVGIDDSTDGGTALGGVEARTQVFFGAACSGLLSNADTAGPSSYTLATNAFCRDTEPPPIARDDSATTDQDQPVIINVVANDTSFAGPARVVAVTDPVNGSVSNNNDGTVTYQPDPGFFSPPSDSFDYTIEDDNGQRDSATVTVFVNSECPAEPDGSFVDDFEPDAEPGWTVETPVNTVGPLSPVWSVVTDPDATSPTQSFFSDATTLDEKDDRLVAPAQDLSSTSQLVFWHRFGFEAGADVGYDGGVLEVSRDGGATWVDVLAEGGSFVEGTYNGVIDSGFGSAIAGRAAWTGGSAADPMSRVTVDLGAYAGFDVLVRWRLVTDPLAAGSVPGEGWWIDDVQFTNTLVVPVDCEPGPQANDDTATTQQGVSVLIDVVANDTHPADLPMTVQSVTQPANGSVTIDGPHTVTYNPDPGFVGVDTFTYTVCDSNGACDTATVTVNVTAEPNNDPVANPDSTETDENTPVAIEVLANDFDPDGDPIRVIGVTQPANGSVQILGDGRIEYTPGAGFSSPPDDNFDYTIEDIHGATDTATVTVTVNPDSDQPCDLCANGKRSELTLTYRGGDCSASDNSQGSKSDCEDFAGPPPTDADVFIIASDDDYADDDSDREWFRGDVSPDQAFTLQSANGGKDDFGSKLFVHVFAAEGGALLQTIEIHTSCSAPLIEGERFGSVETGDGDSSGVCEAPPSPSGRVHGSGFWEGLLTNDESDSGSGKVNFSFNARFYKGALKGKLKLKDKEADVKIDAKQIDSLSTGDGSCNGVATGTGAFEFTATGTFESGDTVVEGATFRACGEDNGKHGKGDDEQPPDRLYVECTSGCGYDSASRTLDDGIDGGNIHLHDPITGEQPRGGAAASGEGGSGASGAASADDPGVLELASAELSPQVAGASLLLSAQLERPLGADFEGVTLELHWRDGLGVLQSLTAITDNFGAALFVTSVEPGATEYWVTAGELDSNRVDVVSLD